jgi:hypothetical protein
MASGENNGGVSESARRNGGGNGKEKRQNGVIW